MKLLDICLATMLVSIIGVILFGALCAISGFMSKKINKCFLYSILTLIISTTLKEMLLGHEISNINITFKVGNIDASFIPVVGILFLIVLAFATFKKSGD